MGWSKDKMIVDRAPRFPPQKHRRSSSSGGGGSLAHQESKQVNEAKVMTRVVVEWRGWYSRVDIVSGAGT